MKMSPRVLRHPTSKVSLSHYLLGLGLGSWLPVCRSLFWTPWAVCPWANSIPSLSLCFLVAKVAMGCEDFLG